MKRLIVILMLSVCQTAIAQLAEFNDTKQYDLTWSLPLGIYSNYAGEAYFSFKKVTDEKSVLCFHVTCPDSVKLIGETDNWEIASIDSEKRVQTITYTSLTYAKQLLKMDYANSVICYYQGDSLRNAIQMDFEPHDIFTAIFLNKGLKADSAFELTIIGYNEDQSGIAWKTAQVQVKKDMLKIQGQEVECLKIEVVMDPKDYLLFGDSISFGKKTTLWVNENMLPVKLQTRIKLLGAIKVQAEMNNARDD